MHTAKFQRNQGKFGLGRPKAIGYSPDFLENYQRKQVNFKDEEAFTPGMLPAHAEGAHPFEVLAQGIRGHSQ